MQLQQKVSAPAQSRLVRYQDLIPCRDAFIDTRTPGSDRKENFTIIGPGVSENPNQHVHITEPHGFNIGGARQPAGCTNSQHSHDTAEVFFVHSGRWAFRLGEHGDMAETILEAGDLISIPTGVFRGFENVGEDEGFLWAVLGGDDPGRVLWAPVVFDMAKDYGLVLMENGSLIDTGAGQTIPEGMAVMPRTSAEQMLALKSLSNEDLLACCVTPDKSHSQRLVGAGGRIAHETGFTIDRIVLKAGETIEAHDYALADVIFLHEGHLDVSWLGEAVTVTAGDTLTIPKSVTRKLTARTDSILIRVMGT